MNQLKTISLRGGDFNVKYYREGSGEHLVFLHSAGGLPAFTPELEALSKRFTVTAPLLPGFGSDGEEHLHEEVQKLVFWVWDLLDALEIERPLLIGHSFGGMLAAEMAATEPRRVRKLVLAAPAGLFIAEHPTLDFFAMTPEALVKAAFHDPQCEAAKALTTPPSDPAAATEAIVGRIRALAAAGRFMWPNGDRGLNERLYRIKAPTLLLWGESDRLIPPVYAEAFRRLLVGAASVRVQIIPAAGHALFAEQRQAALDAIINFLND
ncbi:MAG: alpha/beta fold hydrolase [Deltaproteobacteria bacterium]|nr:alpha/beta fold hydrolase [Deltaproteobacteria bacterium]